MRKNNVNDMTITEQLNQMAEDFCTKYCKYPATWDAEKEGVELCDSEICSNCPLSRL